MFSRLTRVFGGPVVVKDLDNVMRMERIHGFFPQAVFVHMRRDESSAGESLLAARRAVWGNAHRWLGVRPPDYDLPETADPHAQVAAQIRAIDAHIETMGEQWGSERVVNIQYETLCAHPAAELSRLADALRLLEVPMEANTDAGPVPTGFDFRRESLALVGQ